MTSKTDSKLLVVLCAFFAAVVPLVAQEKDEAIGPRGFVRLLDAVACGSGKLDFLIDGRKAREEGYELGDVTGGIARKPGSYKVTFRREGVEEGETKITLAKNETTTLIPFAELVPATPDKTAYWKIRILKLKQLEEKEKRTATIVNVTSEPELKVEVRSKNGTWDARFVKRLELKRMEIYQKSGYVPLRVGSKNLKPLSVGTSGNFVAVIYQDSEGVTQSQNFQDYKYLSAE